MVKLDPPFRDQATDEPWLGIEPLRSLVDRQQGGSQLFVRTSRHAALLVAEGHPLLPGPGVSPQRLTLAIGRGRRRCAAAAVGSPGGPDRPGPRAPRSTGPGRLPKHLASPGATAGGRRGGRPASCRTSPDRQASATATGTRERHGQSARTPALRCRIEPYLDKAAPAAPLARRQRRRSALGGPRGARRATPTRHAGQVGIIWHAEMRWRHRRPTRSGGGQQVVPP
jgi:hypothetical protein